jgi:hypothetical protein
MTVSLSNGAPARRRAHLSPSPRSDGEKVGMRGGGNRKRRHVQPPLTLALSPQAGRGDVFADWSQDLGAA